MMGVWAHLVLVLTKLLGLLAFGVFIGAALWTHDTDWCLRAMTCFALYAGSKELLDSLF